MGLGVICEHEVKDERGVWGVWLRRYPNNTTYIGTT